MNKKEILKKVKKAKMDLKYEEIIITIPPEDLGKKCPECGNIVKVVLDYTDGVQAICGNCGHEWRIS